MSWLTTADPIRDAAIKDAQDDAWLWTRPICEICGEHIQEDTAFHLADNEWICLKCVRENTCFIG